MKYKISDDRKKLTITCSMLERNHLAEERTDKICTDSFMWEWFENLTANSELEWIRPEDTGDLTSAPMLGILGEERPVENRDSQIVHRISGNNLIQEIEERWAFMDYQVRSPLEDLRDKGEAVFIGGPLKS